MALAPVKPLYSGSATATNGSDVITVTGNVNCSFLASGAIVSLGTRQLVDAISGTAPDLSGNSTIKLRRAWADPTTTGKLLVFMSWEGLADAVNRLREIINASEAGLAGAFTYMGAWSAASGNFPTAPAEGLGSQMYRISVAGAMGGRAYRAGEAIYYDQYASTWRSIFDLASPFSTGLLAGANAAAWQTALGLVPTNNATDTTTGRLLQVGDGNLQSNLYATSLPNISSAEYVKIATVDGLSASIGDAISGLITTTGFIGSASRSSYFIEASQRGAGLTLDLLQVSRGLGASQRFFYKPISTILYEIWVLRPAFDSAFMITALSRPRNGGTLFSRVLVAQSTDPGGLIEAIPRKIYDTGNILGTVTQSADVPTGSIIQRGSNAQGEFVRFADGTQICYHNLGSLPHVADTSKLTTWTFPAAFAPVGFRFVVPKIRSASATGNFSILKETNNFAGVTSVELETKVTVSQNHDINVFAIGRWY